MTFPLPYLFQALVVVLLVSRCHTQTNTPADPLWQPFIKALSAETGRTEQDLNTLGLSDPTISKLWSYYTSNIKALAAQQLQQVQQQQQQQQQQAPLPNVPDIYQSAYKFSASSSNTNPGATQTSSSSSSPSQISYQSLMDQYLKLSSSPTSVSTSTSTSSQMSYDQLLDQYKQITSGQARTTNSASSPSYQTLVQQYQALLQQQAANSPTVPPQTNPPLETTSPTGSSPSPTFEQQLLSLFPQFQTTSTAGSGGAMATATNEVQTSSGNTPSNLEQMIFDALLFGQPATTQTSPASSSTSTSSPTSTPSPSSSSSSSSSSPSSSANSPSSASSSLPASATSSSTPAQPTDQRQTNNSPLSQLQNMVNGGQPAGKGNMFFNHIENTFKARASREMGCRFMHELLEVEMLPMSPLNCVHKCPFPYINAQRFGTYCLCCPPGVNSNVANIVSIFKRANYVESPLTVMSR